MGIEIRIANESDLENILKLEKHCFENEAWTKDMINNDFNKRSFMIYACTEDEEPVGYVNVLDLEVEAEILRICVAKPYRNRGMGKKLLQFVIDYCKEEKYDKIFLEVKSTNKIAIDLYERMGFYNINARKNYYASGEDALIYSLLI